MTPPEKCEAERRAVIICTDLAELEELSGEAKVLFKGFEGRLWQWHIVISHPILPQVVPGQFAPEYPSVFAFNKMVEHRIADAIAGKPSLSEDQQKAAAAQSYQAHMQAMQNNQLGQLYGQLYSQSQPYFGQPQVTYTGISGGMGGIGTNTSSTTGTAPTIWGAQTP